MWFFMILCYLLTFVTFIMLFLNGLQGYFHFTILNAGHAAFAILTIIIYLFTETLVIFYFVGIGVSIKEYVRTHHLNADFHRRSIAIKRKVYPPLLLNMFFVMVLFITGGAVDTKRLPGWLHGLLFYLSLAHLAKAVWIQHQSFKESTAIVLDMAGIKR